ncbi:hypothetical protein EIN_207380 [Entamoeba invadens IP1]|uniref:C2 NT-type domain-containing protein n=1 Tax=Entamoeba invadens IP1 TaxID=370355 RepID=A0A0A1U9L8_ENTIV|nr:hypothetical protein EIN_207380 [Entamoeba invadens IP1]ELP91681.1 hypothetical protein EIN_207380 [Entamoeba invadens IP1]|eukprot:XP_004258452.1 hypothetical protein EIN_207380 [Entamoeba invadens IP1]
MFRHLAHSSQKYTVTFTLIRIQVTSQNSSSRGLMCKMTRGKNFQIFDVHLETPLQNSFYFIGKFYLTKTGAQEKMMDLTLFSKSNPHNAETIQINVSQFFPTQTNSSRKIIFDRVAYNITFQISFEPFGLNIDRKADVLPSPPTQSPLGPSPRVDTPTLVLRGKPEPKREMSSVDNGTPHRLKNEKLLEYSSQPQLPRKTQLL